MPGTAYAHDVSEHDKNETLNAASKAVIKAAATIQSTNGEKAPKCTVNPALDIQNNARTIQPDPHTKMEQSMKTERLRTENNNITDEEHSPDPAH